MNCFTYKVDYLNIINDENKKIISKLNIVNFKDRKCYFIEAVDNVNPIDYTIDIFEKFKERFETSCIYIDLSNIYGCKNNSWILKWKFISNDGKNLDDEEFYRLKDLKDIDKEEYVIVKDYIQKKYQNISL